MPSEAAIRFVPGRPFLAENQVGIAEVIVLPQQADGAVDLACVAMLKVTMRRSESGSGRAANEPSYLGPVAEG
jgi:hypothetical protein